MHLRATVRRITQRHRSDWMGFGCFLALAVLAILRAPRAGGLMVLPLVLLDALTAVAFLTRRRLQRQSPQLLPQICAYLGAFGLAAFLLVVARIHPQWVVLHSSPAVKVIALLCWVTGTALPVLIVWRLRHAFSIVPQARQLVTTGPYGFARHPIYACHLVREVGYCLVFWNWPFVLAVAVSQSLMLVRVRYEERVLTDAFPEYAAYRRRVGMFCPRLWPRSAGRRAAAAAATSTQQAKAA